MCLLCRQGVSGQLVQCVSAVPAGVSGQLVQCVSAVPAGVSGQSVQYVSAVPAGGVRSVSTVCVCCAGRGCQVS